jgi:hypothetical protein
MVQEHFIIGTNGQDLAAQLEHAFGVRLFGTGDQDEAKNHDGARTNTRGHQLDCNASGRAPSALSARSGTLVVLGTFGSNIRVILGP